MPDMRLHRTGWKPGHAETRRLNTASGTARDGTQPESERTRNKHIWTLGLLKMAKVWATELSGGERRGGVFKNSGQKSSKLNKNYKF